MPHVLIILTLIFIQGHTDLNHEHKYMFDYFKNGLKVYIICSQSDDLDFHYRPKLRLKLDNYFTLL